MKKALIPAICLVAGVLLFVHAFRGFNYQEAWHAIMTLPWYAIPAFFLLTLSGFVLSAWRWKIFVPEKILRWIPSFTIHTIAGFMMSYLTPATLLSGEPVKMYLLREYNGVRLRTASTSVVMDKFIELTTITVFITTAALMAVSKGFLGADEQAILFIAIPLLILALASACGAYARSRAIAGWILGKMFRSGLPAWAQHIRTLETEVMAYFSHHRAVLLQSFAVGLVVWVVKLVEIGVFLACLRLRPTILQYFIVAFLPMLSWLLPIPAGLGAMESSILALFYLFGWDASTAGAYIIITRLRDICFVAVGFVHTFRHGFNATIRSIFKTKEKAIPS